MQFSVLLATAWQKWPISCLLLNSSRTKETTDTKDIIKTHCTEQKLLSSVGLCLRLEALPYFIPKTSTDFQWKFFLLFYFNQSVPINQYLVSAWRRNDRSNYVLRQASHQLLQIINCLRWIGNQLTEIKRSNTQTIFIPLSRTRMTKSCHPTSAYVHINATLLCP